MPLQKHCVSRTPFRQSTTGKVIVALNRYSRIFVCLCLKIDFRSVPNSDRQMITLDYLFLTKYHELVPVNIFAVHLP